MYQKLLALLVVKFAQARKDGLSQMARSMALQVADETEAQALVDKIQDSQVTEFIKDWRKDIDSEISKGTTTHEANLKAKYDFVEKKTPTKPIVKTGEPEDIATIVANAVAAAMQPLQEKLQGIESGKTSEDRKAVLMGKLEGAPEVYKNSILKNFDRMSFETQEEFETFVTETEADGKTIEQNTADNGLGLFPTPISSTEVKVSEAVSSDIADWAKENKVE